MLALNAAGGRFPQSVQVFALESNDADAMDVLQFAAKEGQRSGRKLNRVIPRGLPARKCFQQEARLAARAASELRHHHRTRKLLHNLPRMRLQNAFFGSRQPILGQCADDFEQRRPHGVVQILGRKLLLSCLAQPGANILANWLTLGDEITWVCMGAPGAWAYSETQRNP